MRWKRDRLAGAAAVAVLLSLAATAPGAAQEETGADPAQGPVFGVGTDAVVLDVVVRDEDGATVRDLTPDEVRVFEDGVEQDVVSFRLVGVDDADPEEVRDAAISAGFDRALGALGPRGGRRRQVNLVTLVFDQLGADGRLIARQAAEELLNLADRPDLVISVFQIKESLRLVQQFTESRQRLHYAVLEATGQVATGYSDATDQLEEAAEAAIRSQEQLDSAAAPTSAAGAAALGRLGLEADVDRMTVDALRMTQRLQREQQGNTSLYALLALARQQQQLAGRKTILFFSEGLEVPSSMEHVLSRAISEANRANVSIYAVDARGLVVDTPLAPGGEMLEQAMAASRRSITATAGQAVTREEVYAADTALTALRIDAQGALEDLALSTGGALIANSNDVRKGIARAVGDLKGYYELVYVPSRGDFDGEFRRIDVKVSRKDVRVQARSGYFAIPPEEGTADFAYEVDLFRALRASPPPAEFALNTGVFRFGPEDSRVRHTAVMEIPLAGIRFEENDGATDRAHFSMMVVLRDPNGAVVEKFSEDSPVFLPRERREALKSGNAIFTRSFAVPPGRYVLEAAVVDRLGQHRSVRREALDVSEPRSRVHLSDLAVIKRTEGLPEGVLPSEDPFRIGESRIVPFVGEPHLLPSDTLGLYVVAYPSGAAPPPALLLEIVQGRSVLVQSLLDPPEPDELGRFPYTASVPIEGLPAGRYSLRVLFKQGAAVAQGQTDFFVDEPGPAPRAPAAPSESAAAGRVTSRSPGREN